MLSIIQIFYFKSIHYVFYFHASINIPKHIGIIGYRKLFEECKRKISIKFVFFIVEEDEHDKSNIHSNIMFIVLLLSKNTY
jgi:hypothetical protein